MRWLRVVVLGLVLSLVGVPAAWGQVRVPSDTGPDGQWWFDAWQIEKVWDAGATGEGVTVAVFDSGVQASRSELSGVVLPGKDLRGGDGWEDRDGHGTHMAILIAGQGGDTGLTGVAPGAKILPGAQELLRNTEWAVDQGARVINMSFIVPGECSPDEAKTVAYALEHGAIVVAGSGNGGESGELSLTLSPASCPGVVVVGAVDSSGALWPGSNRGPHLGLAAPGVHMVEVDNVGERGYVMGTSDATALVSGVMALVWSAHPELSNRQVVARVLATAKDLGEPGRDDGYGFGVARPLEAVTADVPLDAPNPIFDDAGFTEDVVSPSASVSQSSAGVVGDEGSSGGVSPVVWVGLGVGAGALVLVVVLGVALTRRRGGPPGPPPGVGRPPVPPLR